MNLFKGFHSVGFENILYSDTDSLMSLRPLRKELIDESRLGAWKLEHQARGVTIWGSKFYKLIVPGKEPLEHVKGVRKSAIT